MFGYYFHGMDISHFVVWFFIYSFFGWAMECVVIRKEKGTWENRGFAKLPFCVIYGFGTFLAFVFFKPVMNNNLLLYISGAICATLFEYATAVVMDKLFGEVWWDYTDKKFNYKGVLCLESTIAWGFLALFIFRILNVRVEKFVMSLDDRLVIFACAALVVSYLVDFTYHFIYSIIHKNDEFPDDEDDDKARLRHKKA